MAVVGVEVLVLVAGVVVAEEAGVVVAAEAEAAADPLRVPMPPPPRVRSLLLRYRGLH